MSTLSLRSRALFDAVSLGVSSRSGTRKRDSRSPSARKSRRAVLPPSHFSRSNRASSGRGLQLLGVDRSVLVRVGALESDFDVSQIFVLADRLVVVRVGDLPVLRGNAIFQFFAVEGAVMIDIELVEQGACGGLRLVQIDRSVLVGIEALDRRVPRTKAKRPSRPSPVTESPPARTQTSEFSEFCIFITVLLGMITGRTGANALPPALLHKRLSQVIWSFSY